MPTPEQQLPPLVYRPAPKQMAVMLLGCLGFVTLGVLFVTLQSRILVQLVGWLSIAFFGLCAVIGAWRLIRRQPSLVITQEGVTLPQLSAHRIDWPQIAGVRIVVVVNQPYLEFVLHDPRFFTAYQSTGWRALSAVNKMTGYGPAVVAHNALPVPLQTVVAQMRRYYPELTAA